ncbi:hypothetical protein GYMLUDRAFT_237272 [Collybiopsis luxurians FD-317 M1]|nr:hypothetical protein GYMLUDRAFT_237272 [Collybiopsis luxurians FD-317 M1]
MFKKKVDSTSAEAASTESDAEKGMTSPIIFEEFPEGGLQAWATVLGALLVQLCGFGYITSFGIYQGIYYEPDLVDNFLQLDREHQCFHNGYGRLAGRETVRQRLFLPPYNWRCHSGITLSLHVVVGGAKSVLSGMHTNLASAPPSVLLPHVPQVFLCQGLGVGIATGMMYVPSVAIISHHFQRRRALAMTLVACGSSLGSIIHPIMLNNLLTRIGFANATRANAGLVSGLLLCGCLLMRTRLPPNAAPIGLREAFVKFAKEKAYACATIGLFIFSIGYFYPLFYIQLEASVHGMSPTFVFYILVILNGTAFLGRLTSSLFVQRLGVANLLTFGMGACSVIIFGMIGLGEGTGGRETASFVIIAALYGFFAGAYISLTSPLLAGFADNQAEIGARIGIGFAFAGIGSLIGGPIDGALATNRFIWWRSDLFSGVSIVQCCLSLGAVAEVPQLVTFVGFCCILGMIWNLRKQQYGSKL